jgi:hypothetical protein
VRSAVMCGPGDVRVEERPDPQILKPRRDPPPVRDLYLRIGPVAVLGHRPDR